MAQILPSELRKAIKVVLTKTKTDLEQRAKEKCLIFERVLDRKFNGGFKQPLVWVKVKYPIQKGGLKPWTIQNKKITVAVLNERAIQMPKNTKDISINDNDVFEAALADENDPNKVTDAQIENFLAFRIRHPGYFMENNRNDKTISQTVDTVEKLAKHLRNCGESRNENPQEYKNALHLVHFYMFDIESPLNSEMRGQTVHLFGAIAERYYVEGGDCSAVEIAQASPLEKDENLVKYHSSLNTESKESFKSSIELSCAWNLSYETKRELIVTGEKSNNDPEIKQMLGETPIRFPRTSKQTNYDAYEKRVDSEGNVFYDPIDSKMRSANSLTSTKAYAKEHYNSEVFVHGSVSKEDQQILREKFVRKCIIHREKKDPEVAGNIFLLKEYQKTGDITKLDDMGNVVRPLFVEKNIDEVD